jgi:glycosyltransferase involved in cell wall biosynthesis
MNLLVITDGITPFVMGGMQRHSFFMVKWLIKNGNTVTLYHCVPTGQRIPSYDDVAVAMELTTAEGRRLETYCITFPTSDKWPGHYIRASKNLAALYLELYRKDKKYFDFIYSKGFTAWSFLKHKKRGIKMPPVGVKLHGLNMYFPSAGIKTKLQSFMLRRMSDVIIREADYNFSYGGHITTKLLDLGVPREKVIEIPTGIERKWICDTERIKTDSAKVNFCFIGRYDRVKGLPEIYRALSLLNQHEGWQLNIVGPIPKESRCTHNKVKYLGVINEESAMMNFLRTQDVLLCPSYSEGMPNAIIEAMACGCAIIATDTGAVPLLVNSETGYLISSPTPNRISGAMLTFLEADNDKRITLKQNARNHIHSNFLWENIATKLQTALSDIAGI